MNKSGAEADDPPAKGDCWDDTIELKPLDQNGGWELGKDVEYVKYRDSCLNHSQQSSPQEDLGRQLLTFNSVPLSPISSVMP